MSGTWWIAAGFALAIGAIVAPVMISYGLRELAQTVHVRRCFIIIGVAGGAVGAAVAVAGARQADSLWWLPALLTWALTLDAAATCDARIRRIPTRLLVRGGTITATLLVLATVATGDWRALVVTAAAVLASGAVVALCWRFAGVGFGDVRLAAAGGLGLGHVSTMSVAVGLALFAGFSVTQAVYIYWRTRNRKAHFALAPALVLGFLAAATA